MFARSRVRPARSLVASARLLVVCLGLGLLASAAYGQEAAEAAPDELSPEATDEPAASEPGAASEDETAPVREDPAAAEPEGTPPPSPVDEGSTPEEERSGYGDDEERGGYDDDDDRGRDDRGDDDDDGYDDDGALPEPDPGKDDKPAEETSIGGGFAGAYGAGVGVGASAIAIDIVSIAVNIVTLLVPTLAALSFLSTALVCCVCPIIPGLQGAAMVFAGDSLGGFESDILTYVLVIAAAYAAFLAVGLVIGGGAALVNIGLSTSQLLGPISLPGQVNWAFTGVTNGISFAAALAILVVQPLAPAALYALLAEPPKKKAPPPRRKKRIRRKRRRTELDAGRPEAQLTMLF